MKTHILRTLTGLVAIKHLKGPEAQEVVSVIKVIETNELNKMLNLTLKAQRNPNWIQKKMLKKQNQNRWLAKINSKHNQMMGN